MFGGWTFVCVMSTGFLKRHRRNLEDLMPLYKHFLMDFRSVSDLQNLAKEVRSKIALMGGGRSTIPLGKFSLEKEALGL